MRVINSSEVSNIFKLIYFRDVLKIVCKIVRIFEKNCPDFRKTTSLKRDSHFATGHLENVSP